MSNNSINSSINKTIVCRANTPPSINVTLNNKTKLIVPYTSLDLYQANPNFNSATILPIYEPLEVTSLEITADDQPKGYLQTTTIHYKAICKCYDNINECEVEGIEVEGDVESDEFEMNMSTTDTVERTVSFTFLGVTASATFTHGVYLEKDISIINYGDWYGYTDNTYNNHMSYMTSIPSNTKTQKTITLQIYGLDSLTLIGSAKKSANTLYSGVFFGSIDQNVSTANYKASANFSNNPIEVTYDNLNGSSHTIKVALITSSTDSYVSYGYLHIPKLETL